MKRYAMMLCGVLGVAVCTTGANASWNSSLGYSGYQPWWNIFAHRNKCLTPEEQRLQHFWHDYYDALKNYYGHLDHMDWVAYYKNHGYQINTGCAAPGQPCRINYAPVFVSPTMQWAVPSTPLAGPPVGGPGGPMMGAPGAPVMPPPGGAYFPGNYPMPAYPMPSGS